MSEPVATGDAGGRERDQAAAECGWPLPVPPARATPSQGPQRSPDSIATLKMQLQLLVDRVATDPSTAASLREDLLHVACLVAAIGGDGTLRLAAAKQRGAPAAALTRLGSDANEEVRIAVARNPATPVDTLRRLAASAATQYAVAGNPSAPPDVLASLAGHWDRRMRRKVAENPGMTLLPRPETLEPTS